jgi:uncharacterized protein YecE (DUF72 family)
MRIDRDASEGGNAHIFSTVLSAIMTEGTIHVPGEICIGTSGWNYSHWKNTFYSGVKRKDWLRHYAKLFGSVEVNATFYRLQERKTFERWREETPSGFRFTIKGNRFLTHNKKLHDPLESIRRERERASALGDKLAVVVWQLPGNLHKHPESLRGFVGALKRWPETRHTIEFRHSSWFDAEIAEILSDSGIANCWSDAADWPMWDTVTTDLVYCRLHGHPLTYASEYGEASIREWADRARLWLSRKRYVYVYFDNDAETHAPKDALRLLHTLSGQ